MGNVVGDSADANVAAVAGTHSAGGDGIRATSTSGNGLSARSRDSVAIFAESVNNTGIAAIGHKEPGISGISDSGDGVRATSTSGNGLSARSANGVGGFFQGGRLAAFFEGDVEVTGDIRLVNADCAEDFDVSGAEKIEPGTVVVCGGNGALRPSSSSYDRRVVGVVSGAGNYKPAIILDRQESVEQRAPVALMGKVFCNVDADENPIEVGDLLTTASTPGHAMKASDPSRAFGAVIGKALRPLAAGRGKIPVLVALQ